MRHVVLGLWLLRNAREALVDLSGSRVAATLSDVMTGLSPAVLRRSRKCKVTVKRVDMPNLRWIFSVDSGNGPKLVRMRMRRPKANVSDVSKMQVWFACSCPAWQWLGPEYHAKQHDYQDRKPVGTATPPDIKDPERVNKVCKHVAAVVAVVGKWRLDRRKASVSDGWLVLVPDDE